MRKSTLQPVAWLFERDWYLEFHMALRHKHKKPDPIALSVQMRTIEASR